MTDIEYLKKYLPKNVLEQGIERLINKEPVQYIVGNVNFYGYNFDVDKRVLIPRFETEELVEKTIAILKNISANLDIVDIGTGSGCIAITLKKELKNANVDAVDISPDALKVAKKNALKNSVNINFYEGNLLVPLTKKYDCIISNPPYISRDEKIMEVVKNNEPHIALYADNDGLKCYEEILKNANNYLKEKALIAFEIGENQALKITELAKKYLPSFDIEVINDLQGRNRFIFLKRGLL